MLRPLPLSLSARTRHVLIPLPLCKYATPRFTFTGQREAAAPRGGGAQLPAGPVRQQRSNRPSWRLHTVWSPASFGGGPGASDPTERPRPRSHERPTKPSSLLSPRLALPAVWTSWREGWRARWRWRRRPPTATALEGMATYAARSGARFFDFRSDLSASLLCSASAEAATRIADKTCRLLCSALRRWPLT